MVEKLGSFKYKFLKLIKYSTLFMLSLQVMITSTAQVRLISSEKILSFYMTQSCQWWPGSKFSGPGTMSPADALHCSVSWS